MEAHVNEFGVEPMCRVLQIALSTWHEHARRKADPDRLPERAKRDAELSVHMRRVFAENFSVYGVRVNGGQDPRKDGGAKFFGMTFANGLAAPYRRPLGGNQRPGGKRCQRRKPPEAGAEGPR